MRTQALSNRRFLRLFSLAFLVTGRAIGRGFAGFRLFMACLALGVGAIAAVGAVASGLTRGIADEGQSLLGGDIEARLTQRQMNAQEYQAFAAEGRVSTVAEMRSMAVTQEAQTLIELKAVDSAYPLFGNVELSPDMNLAGALQKDANGNYGAIAESVLAARLDVKLGDEIRVGNTTFILRALIMREPDRIAGGLTFGPRLMIAREALASTGLDRQGALINWLYRLRLPPSGSSSANVTAVVDSLNNDFLQSGWRVRDSQNAAPSVKRFVDRIAMFLTFVGFTSLVLGGVGVANAVRNHLEREREVIAIFKCVGATAIDVACVYISQILLLASLGIAFGLVMGAVAPFLIDALFGQYMPVPLVLRFDPWPLLLAAAYGFLVSFSFSLWPVWRAANLKPAGLFRAVTSAVMQDGNFFRSWRVILICSAALSTAGLLTFFLSGSQDFSAWLLAGLVASFAIFWGLAHAVMDIARRIPHPRSAILRLVLANLHRPGTPTPFIVLSLGLGLTLFATTALIDANFALQVKREIPSEAPAFFFVDLQPGQRGTLHQILKASGMVRATEEVPMLRGFVTRLKGVPVSKIKVKEGEGAWILRGDRGLTFALHPPKDTQIVAGRWWTEAEAGQKLLSFDAESATELGLKVGDSVSISVLGREITATITNLRQIDWADMGINFVMVFSPGALASAPHTLLTTVTLTQNSDAALMNESEEALRGAVVKALPNVTVIRVKEALADVGRILEQIATGVRLASIVTLISGILVLTGAMAANFHARVYDSVILKVLGATRGRILAAYALEYGLLGFLSALIATGLGIIAARFVIVTIMEMRFSLVGAPLIGIVFAGIALTLGFGLLSTYRALSAKPAPILRNL